jgi:hypothetical protein
MNIEIYFVNGQVTIPVICDIYRIWTFYVFNSEYGEPDELHALIFYQF